MKAIGFTKISIGVESFSDNVINKTGRKITTYGHVAEVIEFAKSLGIWVNVDMMVGLPDQITIYPFMIIRGVKAIPGAATKEQFKLIEKSGEMLKGGGYSRKSVWVFARGDNIYDSSRDELIEDYAGFGPAAFSTYGNWKVVNPELDVYVKNFRNDKRMGFVAPKTRASDEWRRFARMIYDLECRNSNDLPSHIRLFIWILKLTGYSKHGILTEKGKNFAHEITKTVVESLPFPVQNPGCVENYEEYVSYKQEERMNRQLQINSSGTFGLFEGVKDATS